MSRRKFSRAFKRSVAAEYVKSGKKRQEIAMKYGLPNVQTVSNWVNCYLSPYEIETKCVSLQLEEASKLQAMGEESQKVALPSGVQDLTSTVEQLQKQVSRLEAKLKRSEDKNLALNTLIDLAEEQGIRIRKKSGAKQ